MEWAQETIIRLRSLWDEGLSTSEIGRRLFTTKNAVVGKAHRLDLPSRPSPIKRDGSGIARPRTFTPRVYKKSLPTLASLSFPLPPPTPKLRMRSVPMKRTTGSLMRLRDTPTEGARRAGVNPPFYTNCGCLWLVGQNGKFPLYCDAKITRGAFCDEHAKKAYIGKRGALKGETTQDQNKKLAA